MNAYDNLPEDARELMVNFDELTIAEMCVNAQAELFALKIAAGDASHEYGAVICERVLGHGVRVLTVPQHAKITPEMLTTGAIRFETPDQLLLADQVSYRITGWDPADNTLTLELVHDHRPEAAG